LYIIQAEGSTEVKPESCSKTKPDETAAEKKESEATKEATGMCQVEWTTTTRRTFPN